jgi:hypothetical protein
LNPFFEAVMDGRKRIGRRLLDAAPTTLWPFLFVCFAIDPRIRYLNSTGTSVNDSARLAISETQTDSDSGEKDISPFPAAERSARRRCRCQRRKQRRHADLDRRRR